jgi:hypothetical protein
VAIYDTAEGDNLTLPAYGLDDKVIVLGEKHPPQFTSAVQKRRVSYVTGSIFMGRDHIDAPQALADCYGAGNMVVHV